MVIEEGTSREGGNYPAQSQQFEANYAAGIGHWRSHPLSPLAGQLLKGARRLMDVGSGGGEKTLAFASRKPELIVVGIDQSKSAVEGARKLLMGNEDLAQRVSFMKADVLSLPFDNDSFDRFHDYLCFTHIHQNDWPQYFEGMARVTPRGGRGLVVAFSKEDRDFYGYPIRELSEDWVIFKNDHDGILRPHLAINDNYGYHFARGHQLFEAVQPLFKVLRLELREHPHPDHKGKRFLWHLLIERN